MSASVKADLEVLLKKLECHFTWDINKAHIRELDRFDERLLNGMRFLERRYHAPYLNLLAFVNSLKENYVSALEYVHQAETTLEEEKSDDAEFLVTYANSAWINYHSGNLEDVETYLGKVKAICETIPDSSPYCSLPAIHGEKGWSFLRLGYVFYERAKQSFQEALKKERENKICNVGYAVVLYRLEGMVQNKTFSSDDRKAVPQLKKALALDPTNTTVMVLLALKLQVESKSESQKLMEDALRLSPDVPHVARHAAKYFRKEGSIQKSLDVLQKVQERSPKSSSIHHQIGLCYNHQLHQMWKKKRPRGKLIQNQIKAKIMECISQFSKAVELTPSNIPARIHLAEAYSNNWQLKEAEKIFTETFSDDSLCVCDKQHCHFCYGKFLYYKKKDEDSAVAQFKTAYQMKIESNDKAEAGKMLKKIAHEWIDKHQRVDKGKDMLTFLATEAEEDTKSASRATNAEELSFDFGNNMKL